MATIELSRRELGLLIDAVETTICRLLENDDDIQKISTLQDLHAKLCEIRRNVA